MQKAHHYIHQLFFPHEVNNFKAKSLHTSSLLFYIIVLVVLQIGTNLLKAHPTNILGYATDINTQRLLELVNQKREENGLKPVILSDQLNTAATNKASDMLTKNYWAHISPTGITPWVFISSAGYNYIYAGENLARSFNTAQEVVDAWMNSPTHRANLLKPEYADMGLAVMNGRLNGEDTTLVVQEFGTKNNKNTAARNDNISSDVGAVLPTVMPGAGSDGETGSNTLIAGTQKMYFLPFTYTKTVSIFVAEFLLIVLLMDSFYIWKHHIFRISGHSIAHIIFLASLIGAMGATGMGVIL